MKTSEFLKSAAVIVVILLVFGLAAFGLNFHTAPLIEANNAGAAFAPLLAVLPSGKNFQEFDPASKNLPENVLKAYEETNGAGFIFEVSATGYKSGLVIRVGIDAEGKIAGSNIVSTNETYKLEYDLNGAYNGQSLDNLTIVYHPSIASGATSQTSSGYFKAIEGALAAHVLVSGGKLDPSIVFEGMIASLHTGMAKDGALKATVVEGSGNIVKGWEALNGTGAAYVISKGEDAYLVIINNSGVAKVYDADKNDVTTENEELVTEAVAAFGTGNDLKSTLTERINTLFSGASNFKMLSLNTFNNVSAAAQFAANGKTLYAFLSSPLTYGDNAMSVLTVIDSEGKIVATDIAKLLYGHGVDYLPIYKQGYGNTDSEKYNEFENSFVGVTEGTVSDDLLITGATISSTAVKNATNDAFAAFNSIKGGEQ